MENEKQNAEKVIGILGLIALRKSDLYNNVLMEASKNKDLSKDSKNKIKNYISSMKNELFLGKDEKKNKKIDAQLRIDELNFDFGKIIKENK